MFLSQKQKLKNVSVAETKTQKCFCRRNKNSKMFLSQKQKLKNVSVIETKTQKCFCDRN